MITGATGFVGRHLLASFLHSNQPIIAIYRNEKKKEETVFFLENQSLTPKHLQDIKWRKANLNDWASLEEAYQGVTKVFHCAALVSLFPGREEKMMATNVNGTIQMLNLAQKNKIEWFGYISSIAALGNANKGKTIDTNHTWNKDETHTAYAYTKHLAELEVWKAMEEGLRGAILNPGVILGLGHYQSPLQQILSHTKGPRTFVSSGSTGFVSINDVVRAAHWIYDDSIHKRRFILVSENWTYQQFFEKISKNLSHPPKIKKLSQKQLWLIYKLEQLLRLFGRKRRLSRALIHSLSATSNYNGNQITETSKDFTYDDLEKELSQLLRKSN